MSNRWLKRGRSDICHELFGFNDRVEKFWCSYCPSRFPAGGIKRFRGRGTCDRSVLHPRELTYPRVLVVIEYKVLVHLIGQDVEVVIDTNACELFQGLSSKYRTRGVMRRVNDDHGSVIRNR